MLRYPQVLKQFLRTDKAYTVEQLQEITGWSQRRLRYSLRELLNSGSIIKLIVLHDLRRFEYLLEVENDGE